MCLGASPQSHCNKPQMCWRTKQWHPTALPHYPKGLVTDLSSTRHPWGCPGGCFSNSGGHGSHVPRSSGASTLMGGCSFKLVLTPHAHSLLHMLVPP